jgi:hypothetical protein
MLSEIESKQKADQTRIELSLIVKSDCSRREITCETCDINDTCDLAWDLYNTDGDCLAIK